jgi:hypothetical protein
MIQDERTFLEEFHPTGSIYSNLNGRRSTILTMWTEVLADYFDR